MTTKKILGLVPTIQAMAIAEENLKLVKKKDKTVGDFAKLGVKSIIGTKLIDIEADLIASL